MKSEMVRLKDLIINLEGLASFLVEAKKNCYAGEGEEKILEDGSKLLTFQKEDFHYTDNYSGWYQAPGSELVRWKNENGQRIWFMAYSGGMFPEFIGEEELTKQTFSLLKKALLTVNSKAPFRAKEAEIIRDMVSVDNILSYQCVTEGDIKSFIGEENIWTTKQDSGVFSQKYIGGLIIPK